MSNFKLPVFYLYYLQVGVNSAQYGVIVPPVVAVITGKTIVLECISSSYTEWTFQGNLVRDASYFLNKIYIPNASPSIAGQYECKGTGERMIPFKAFADVFVGSEYLILFILPIIICVK